MSAGEPQRKSLEPFLKDSVVYYSHQVDGVRYLAKKNSFLLADDMGLGKSLQALTVFCIALKMRKAETLIIVCPVTLRENWADEIDKFTRIPYMLLGEEPHPLKYGQKKKLGSAQRVVQLAEWMLSDGPRILIVNYEQLVSKSTADLFSKFTFDVAIFDEAHMIKNPQSLRTKAALKLRSKRSFMLTGTPILNQITELWPLLHRIDPTRWPKYWSFVNRYCVYGGYENKQIIGVKNKNEILKALGEVQLRRRKKDVLDLPPIQSIQVRVGLTEVQRRLYDALADEFILPDPDENAEGKLVKDAIVQALRLKQICGTPYSIDPSYEDSSLKLDRVIEIALNQVNEGDKVAIFTQFRGVHACIVRRLAEAKFKEVYKLHGDVPTSQRQEVIKTWGSVNGPSVVVCMSQVAGVGLNMTAARVGILVDKLFVPGLNQQIIDRLHRIGQSTTQQVQIYEMLAKGTVEDRIEQILKSKTKLVDGIVETGVGMRNLLAMLKQELMKNE